MSDSILSKIGDFVGDAAPLIGGVIGGPGGAIVSKLLASTLGTKDDPEEILKELQRNPDALLKVKQLESEERTQLRKMNLQMAEAKMKDKQHEHETTQETIQVGDTAEDSYVRHTRPKMARMSFYSGTAYVFVSSLLAALNVGTLTPDPVILSVMYGPAFTYMGMRTVDAFSKHKGPKMGLVTGQIKNAVNTVKNKLGRS